jgi:RimJ/RimL family protein N-acetyltransferase
LIDILWGGPSLNPELHAAMISYADDKIGGYGLGFGNCKTMAAFDGGQLLGVVVFHNWQPQTGVIEITAASESKRWLARRVLDRIFRYAFVDAQCQLVVARISERNTGLHRIFHAYGFESIVIKRLRGRGEDERIFSLTDDAWRASKFYRGD